MPTVSSSTAHTSNLSLSSPEPQSSVHVQSTAHLGFTPFVSSLLSNVYVALRCQRLFPVFPCRFCGPCPRLGCSRLGCSAFAGPFTFGQTIVRQARQQVQTQPRPQTTSSPLRLPSSTGPIIIEPSRKGLDVLLPRKSGSGNGRHFPEIRKMPS